MRTALLLLALSFIALASEEDALLKAIHDNPDEDTVRLVYADWLDEHDRPERAEFIRVQVELARMEPGKGKYSELVGRQAELLRDPRATGVPAWFAEYESKRTFRPLPHIDLENHEVTSFRRLIELQPHKPTPRLALADFLDEHEFPQEARQIRRDVRRDQIELTFKRGFLEKVTCGANALFEKGAEFLGKVPFLREIEIYYEYVGPNMSQEVARVLADSPIAAQLHVLNVRDLDMNPAAVRALGPKLRNLRSLDISGFLGNNALAEILMSPLAGRLSHLSVEHVHDDAHLPELRDALTRLVQGKHLVEVSINLRDLLPWEFQKKVRGVAGSSNCMRFVTDLTL